MQDNPARATIASLAREAGVAASTVSRALKGDPRISPAMRDRITALAQAAGYTPNALARTLVGGRSQLIGLVLGPIENPIYAEMMQAVVAEAARRELRVLLLHVGRGPIEDSTAAALLQYKMDGCLITSAELSSRAASVCAANGVPVVMVNRVPRLHASAVACDNRAGCEELAAHLLEGGHRRFAIVTGNPDSSNNQDRAEGFARCLRAAGLPEPLLVPGGASHAAGYAAGSRLAALPPDTRPDAVFAVSDILAMGVIDALRAAGLRVPEDVSVAGFDGIAIAAGPPYRLTTVAQPLAPMVARGLDLLVADISGARVPDDVISLRGTLMLRGSTRNFI
ncbi:LacI family transcriptional regulator [Roseomonas sp. GC11]|uniref:LacI family DNA-binding transcriptional regulator n=1 Tax=Roseomonas sp. GC11 TaxID=2950546 RepID=UPI00210D6D14|nr:LacI family DNA-binding transcriptional regulator [Roseomonas sp. GC11]MCQ4161225.1 LacI family transcriptional regulator [Roseomonas sp. GC11]